MSLIAGLYIPVDELQKQSDEMDDWQLKDYLAHYTGDTFKGNKHRSTNLNSWNSNKLYEKYR